MTVNSGDTLEIIPDDLARILDRLSDGLGIGRKSVIIFPGVAAKVGPWSWHAYCASISECNEADEACAKLNDADETTQESRASAARIRRGLPARITDIAPHRIAPCTMQPRAKGQVTP